MLIIIIGLVILIAVVSYAWVKGVDYMYKNYPDYKGEDFLDWDKEAEDYEIGPFNTPEKKVKK